MWLRIAAAIPSGGTRTELSPREKLGAVPFASYAYTGSGSAVTSIVANTGLTGNTNAGVVTLVADTAYLQRRISQALIAINPSASTPYVIEVRAGTYEEIVRMRSYVSLRGAGAGSSIIYPPGNTVVVNSDEDLAAVVIKNLVAVEVSGFTLQGGTSEGFYTRDIAFGVWLEDSTVVLSDLDIRHIGIAVPLTKIRHTGLRSLRASLRSSDIGASLHRTRYPLSR